MYFHFLIKLRKKDPFIGIQVHTHKATFTVLENMESVSFSKTLLI